MTVHSNSSNKDMEYSAWLSGSECFFSALGQWSGATHGEKQQPDIVVSVGKPALCQKPALSVRHNWSILQPHVTGSAKSDPFVWTNEDTRSGATAAKVCGWK